MQDKARFPDWVKILRKIFYCLFLVRFNLIILVAGWLLLQVDQGQDALISYAVREDWLNAGFWFFLWVFYWAFSIWFFARTMFRFQFPTTPIRKFDDIPNNDKIINNQEITTDDPVFIWMKKYLPRILGTVAFLAVAHALWSAHSVVESDLAGRFLLWVIISLVLIIPFFLIVNFRRNMANAISTRLAAHYPNLHDSRLGKAFQTTKVEHDLLYGKLFDMITNP